MGTSFVTHFQATVTDSFGNLVSNVPVTFAAPASGASGTFSGSASVTVSTNALGVAIAPEFTATGTAGSYAVTASAGGAGGTLTGELRLGALQTAQSGLLPQAWG